MNITALYAGSFDPITNGHSDLIRSALDIFDKVIVAVAANPTKEPLFTLGERVQLANEVLTDIKGVTIIGFDNLLIDCARQNGAKVILRGLRAVSDFEYEFQMAGMNRRLAPDIETVFMPPSEHDTFISASLVKEIASLGGKVGEFVDGRVEAALSAKFG